MSKKGPLSKAERHYIDTYWAEKDVKIIASDLDRAISSIERYIDEIKLNKVRAKGQFARHGDPEKGGAVVATEAATMMGDDFKKSGTKNRRQSRCTVKISDI